MRITEEPEFVFYHNPIKGVFTIQHWGDVDVDKLVRESFRRLSHEEILSLRKGMPIYCGISFEDERLWNPNEELFSALNVNSRLHGFMRAQVTRNRGFAINYKTKGNCSGWFYTDDPVPWVYSSPDLDKINNLISWFGEGIVVPPTREEGLRLRGH